MRKRIVIKTSGPIYPKSGLYGPMLTPFMEDIQTIQSLVVTGYDVREVLADGKQVKLTLENLSVDNNSAVKAEKQKAEAEKAKAEAEKAKAEAAKQQAAKEEANRKAAKVQQDKEKQLNAKDNNKKVEDAAEKK